MCPGGGGGGVGDGGRSDVDCPLAGDDERLTGDGERVGERVDDIDRRSNNVRGDAKADAHTRGTEVSRPVEQERPDTVEAEEA